jgi:hypothetical protein
VRRGRKAMGTCPSWGDGQGCQATEGMDGTRKYAWFMPGSLVESLAFFMRGNAAQTPCHGRYNDCGREDRHHVIGMSPSSPLHQDGILRTTRKAVNLPSTRSTHTAPASQSDGAENTRCRGFKDCGLFLILEALAADITCNRGIGKKSARKPTQTKVASVGSPPMRLVPPETWQRHCPPAGCPVAESPVRPNRAFLGWAWFPPLSADPRADAQKSCLRSACHEESFYHRTGREDL